MPLSGNEIRYRAIQFPQNWAGTRSEAAEKQTFWNEFFDVFGIQGDGGCGVSFILVKGPDVKAAMNSWTRVMTNSDGVGHFSVVIPTTAESSMYFRVKAE